MRENPHPGNGFLGLARSPALGSLFQNAYAQTGLRQVGRSRHPVGAPSDDDDIVSFILAHEIPSVEDLRLGRFSFLSTHGPTSLEDLRFGRFPDAIPYRPKLFDQGIRLLLPRLLPRLLEPHV